MIETKFLQAEDCEFKFSDEDYRVEGYASTFNGTDSQNDTILPGAFSKFLEGKRMPYMRFEHLPWVIPGKWIAANEDQKGLHIVGELTRGHSASEDLRASMRHGTIRGLSIGFQSPNQNTFQRKSTGGRLLSEINLVEVSFTHNPSDRNAVIESFKSEVGAISTLADMENFLRDVGNISKSMAMTLMSQMKTVIRSESETAREQEIKAATELKGLFKTYDLSDLIR